ncbi:MAG: hypothetical protein O7F14_08905 [Alphaproteobacteria bacterium]|nr:hypothetical protein [Alphaproteobacteria bacterium]
MPGTVTIKSLPEAFAVIKEMQGQDCEWGEDYRAAGRTALAEILEGQMALRVDRHLQEMAAFAWAIAQHVEPTSAPRALAQL